MPPRPFALDTDIGGDFDDAWALALALSCPELALRLVVCSTGHTEYRARVATKQLLASGRADIPVAVAPGEANSGYRDRQAAWVEGWRADDYPGAVVRRDAVGALAEELARQDDPLLVAIGPMTTVAEFARRFPGLAQRTTLCAMFGSLAANHRDAPGAIAEFNVVKDINAAQRVARARWRELRVTPLDSCGHVVLRGDDYARVRDATAAPARALMDAWRSLKAHWDGFPGDAESESSILYDTVAVWLALGERHLAMETRPLYIDDAGFTRTDDPRGLPARFAVGWTDKPAFLRAMAARLAGDPDGA